MGIIDITQATVRSEGPSFNKFDITKDNLKKRIMIPSLKIAQVYVHSIYRSEGVLEENNGRTRMEWDNSTYAGTYICLGDFDKVSRAPSYGDPEACPGCAALHSGPKVVSPPRKQYALSVLEYRTKPNTFQPSGTSVEAKLWKHGDDKKISPIITALQETGRKIPQIDFLIECPSDGIQFKKWQINFSEQVAYEKDDELKKNIQEAMKNDLYSEEELLEACGEKVTREQLQMEVKMASNTATAGQQAPPSRMFEEETTDSPSDDLAEMAEMSASDIDALL